MKKICFKGKEYLVKYKGCHHKQERESQTCNEEKLKNKYPPTNGLSVDEGINPF
jgi:hypothetical protein